MNRSSEYMYIWFSVDFKDQQEKKVYFIFLNFIPTQILHKLIYFVCTYTQPQNFVWGPIFQNRGFISTVPWVRSERLTDCYSGWIENEKWVINAHTVSENLVPRGFFRIYIIIFIFISWQLVRNLHHSKESLADYLLSYSLLK